MNAGREKVVREGACRVCGVEGAHLLEAAHLWPRGRGGGGFNDPNLIVPLCSALKAHGCHALFDSHSLDILPYLTLDEQVALTRAAGGIARAYRQATGTSFVSGPDVVSNHG